MKISRTKAPRASSSNSVINGFQGIAKAAAIIAIACVLWSCASRPPPVPAAPRGVEGPQSPPPALPQGKSRWVPVSWSELPGFADDKLFEAWNGWVRSCERPGATFAPLCADVRRLSIATEAEQREWMMARLQPYRVEALQGSAEGQLTSYYEPMLNASRQPGGAYTVPLYRPPAGLGSRKPWFSRQEIDTSPEARAALQGREIAWLADPVDAMSLHIQGSGRLSIAEPDGSRRVVRVAFAGTNDQPFRSIAQWLSDHGAGRMAPPWTESTKAWAARNPHLVQQMLWSNPRYVFFREEALSDFDAGFGPKGAQGVALTPGRSIAVDPGSIPYGTPVWLASRGSAASLQRLVFAQDTGSAIVGAVRADYFAGTGAAAGEFASRMNQPLRLWVLWPK